MMTAAETAALNVDKIDDPRTGESRSWEARARLLDRDILLVRGALPFAADLVEDAEKAAVWEQSSVLDAGAPAYLKPEHRSSESCVLGRTPALRPYARCLAGLEGAFSMLYTGNVNPHARVRQALAWELLRYKPGTFFREHIDVVPGDAVLAQRTLAVVGFCNEDYEGGELVFPRQRISIKPEAGAVVIFPATFTHPHEVRAVMWGTRYSLVTWFGHFPAPELVSPLGPGALELAAQAPEQPDDVGGSSRGQSDPAP